MQVLSPSTEIYDRDCEWEAVLPPVALQDWSFTSTLPPSSVRTYVISTKPLSRETRD